MSGSSLIEIVEAMADALEPIRTAIPEIQIHGYLVGNPTPPTLDIYPGDPFFQTGSGFGDDIEAYFTVRARTGTADPDAGQRVLYRLLDPRAAESVQLALEADQTLGGTAQSIDVVGEGVTGFREYLEDPVSNGRLIGCEWRVRVIT